MLFYMYIVMRTNVRQWGNSIGIRIPKPFAKEMGITDGSELEINVLDRKIVLSKPKISLSQLLEKITVDNLHAETDTGFIKGKEIW